MNRSDEDGQPLSPFAGQARNNERKSVDQLTGLCRGILCDGVVNTQEAEAFAKWVEANKHLLENSIFGAVVTRIERIYSDKKIDELEREELTEIMRQLCGFKESEIDVEAVSTDFPICRPAPEIKFCGSEFVITGKCAFGTRATVAAEIEKRGGITGAHPTHSTRYLLIGHFSSRDWIHSTHGRKIERAVELRSQRTGISIISESHWVKTLNLP